MFLSFRESSFGRARPTLSIQHFVKVVQPVDNNSKFEGEVSIWWSGINREKGSYGLLVQRMIDSAISSVSPRCPDRSSKTSVALSEQDSHSPKRLAAKSCTSTGGVNWRPNMLGWATCQTYTRSMAQELQPRLTTCAPSFSAQPRTWYNPHAVQA